MKDAWQFMLPFVLGFTLARIAFTEKQPKLQWLVVLAVIVSFAIHLIIS